MMCSDLSDFMKWNEKYAKKNFFAHPTSMQKKSTVRTRFYLHNFDKSTFYLQSQNRLGKSWISTTTNIIVYVMAKNQQSWQV